MKTNWIVLELLRVLYQISANSSKPDEIIKYGEELILQSKRLVNRYYECLAYSSNGSGYRRKGDIKKAIKFFFESSKIAIDLENESLLCLNYVEISTTYSLDEDIENAIKFNKKALMLIGKMRHERRGRILLNIGYDFYTLQEYGSSLAYYVEAEQALKLSNSSRVSLTYVKGNRALVKWKLGDIQNAITDLNEAIVLLKSFGDRYAMADYYNQLGNIYLEQDSLEQAILYLSLGVNMAKAVDLKEQVRDASKLLSETYDRVGQRDSAYHYLSQYLVMRDSIQSEATTRELANQRADFEIGLKEAEVQLVEARRKNQQMTAIAIGSVLALLGFFGYRYQQNRSKKRLEKESIDKRMAELTALKAQINPHFLFNALNSIHAYILKGDQSKAEGYLKKYGKLMRMILNHSNDLVMTLQEELDMLRLYSELEQIRVKGGFTYQVEISADIDTHNSYVPSMVIQPFLENAIWHGVSKVEGERKIELAIRKVEDMLEVVVMDNGAGFDTSSPRNQSSKGVGLVHERLELLRESKGSEAVLKIESEPGAGTKVTLRFPVDLV